MNFGIFLLSCSVICISLGCVVSLAQKVDRWLYAKIWCIGFIVALAKISLVVHAPQWLDYPVDSITYAQNAKALWSHWYGYPVDAKVYMLRGLKNDYLWAPDAVYPYFMVLGSHEWVYPGYLALWWGVTQQENLFLLFATASNAPFMAISVVASFGISQALFDCRKVGTLAATFSILDPSAAVNGSWLLKDSMATTVFMLAVWSFLLLKNGPQRSAVFWFVCSLSFLGAVRYVGFVAINLAIFLVIIQAIFSGKANCGAKLVISVIAAILLYSFLYWMPNFKLLEFVTKTSMAVVNPLNGAGSVMLNGDDPAVSNFYSQNNSPFLSVARAMARTVFAPYPWVPLTQGLNWSAYTELYYPGVLWWLMTLPGILLALRTNFKTVNTDKLFVILVGFFVISAYIAIFGEWSTRQRAFLLPLFFVMSAIGYAHWLDRLLAMINKVKK